MAMPAAADRVVHASAGDAHTALVDASGALWLCGSDRWLQLGQEQLWAKGTVWKRTPVPVASVRAVRMVQAACGADHTIALDDSGRVWAFGRGEHGQLFGAAKRPFTSPPSVSPALSSPSHATGEAAASTPVAHVTAAGNCSCVYSGAGELLRCVGRCKDVEGAHTL